MENKKLFVIDLDGTALLNFTTLHPRTIEGVKHLKSLGHEVVIATGRSECACIRFYNELNLNTPLISNNGAVLKNPTDSSYVGWMKFVNQDLIDFVLGPEIINDIENIYYYADGKIHIHRYHELLMEKLLMTGCEVDVMDMHEARNVNSIALLVLNESHDKVKATIQSNFSGQDFNSWDGNHHESYIEVSSENTDKWQAVCKVAEDLNIDSSNVYTFGDANNDYMMIKECENGIVMKNATQKLKNVGNVILDFTNEEGGVGEFMLSID